MVCTSSAKALSALQGNDSSGTTTPNPPTYSSHKFGPKLLGYYFHLVYGDEFKFHGARDVLEVCNPHYQHFLKKPPAMYRVPFEEQQCRAWIGWAKRTCCACGFHHSDRDPSVTWDLAGGLSRLERRQLVELLLRDSEGVSHISLPEGNSLMQSNSMSASNDEPILSNIDWICSLCWKEHGFRPASYKVAAGPSLPGDSTISLSSQHLRLGTVTLDYDKPTAARGSAIRDVDRYRKNLESDSSKDSFMRWQMIVKAAVASGIDYCSQELSRFGIVYTLDVNRHLLDTAMTMAVSVTPQVPIDWMNIRLAVRRLKHVLEANLCTVAGASFYTPSEAYVRRHTSVVVDRGIFPSDVALESLCKRHVQTSGRERSLFSIDYLRGILDIQRRRLEQVDGRLYDWPHHLETVGPDAPLTARHLRCHQHETRSESSTDRAPPSESSGSGSPQLPERPPASSRRQPLTSNRADQTAPGLHTIFLPELMEFLEQLTAPRWSAPETSSNERLVRRSFQLANIICQLVNARDPRVLFLQYLNGIICDAGGLKKRQWRTLCATTGAICGYDGFRDNMVKDFAKAWVISSCLHGNSGVVFSFDNLNWVLGFAVALLYKGNVNNNPTRAVNMLTGQINQLRVEDCDDQDKAAYAPPAGQPRPKAKQVMDFKESGDGLSQFRLPEQERAWDGLLSHILDTFNSSSIDPETGVYSIGNVRLVDALRDRLAVLARTPPARGHMTTMATIASGSSATLADIETYLLNVKSDLRVGQPGGPVHILVVGDQQTYALVLDLVRSHPKEWTWVHAYPGDWHILLNSCQNLIRMISEGGGEQAAAACGLTKFTTSPKFRDGHMVLLALWHAWSASLFTLWTNWRDSPSDGASSFKRFLAFLQISDQNPNQNLRFWAQWFEVATGYVAQYLAIRCSIWDLRGAAIHHLAPLFYAYRRFKYEALIAKCITDAVTLPSHYLEPMKEGKIWMVSARGRPGYSWAIDEAHESIVNRHLKAHVDRVSEEWLVECAGFVNHSVGSVIGLRRTLGFADEKMYKKPTPEPLAVKKLAKAIAPIRHYSKTSILRRATSDAFGADERRPLEARQSASLLSFLSVGSKTLLQFMRQVHMRPVPYELKRPLPAKASTFAAGPKQSRQKRAAEKRNADAFSALSLQLKRSTGAYVANSAIPLAFATPDGKKRKSNKAAAFEWLCKFLGHSEVPVCIKLQLPQTMRVWSGGWGKKRVRPYGLFFLGARPPPPPPPGRQALSR